MSCTESNRSKVLVTDGNTRTALAVTRSLGRRGIPVLVIAERPDSLAFRSRYAADHLLLPSPATEPDAFFKSVLQSVRHHGVELIIPASDSALVAFERHREALEPETRLAMSGSLGLRRVLDKHANLELARNLGVPCPKQFHLQSPAQIPEMIRQLGFPVVLKTGDALEGEGFDFRLLYAHNEEELRSHIARHCRPSHYPIFQQYVTGDLHSLSCFAVKGELVAVHGYQTLRRTSRGLGEADGQSIFRRIEEPIPELAGYAKAMLRELEWDGVAQMAFFVSPDRKRAWYLETNGRFWGSCAGSINAGWDFPYWTYEYFLRGVRPRPGPLKVRSVTCWHMADFVALVRYLKGFEPVISNVRPGKLRAVLDFVAGLSPANHSDVGCWGDPAPALAELGQIFRRYLEKKLRKEGSAKGVSGKCNTAAVLGSASHSQSVERH
jgi:carbamoylphosphate synthase large subunit